MEKRQYESKILPLFEHDLNAITDYIAYRLRNPDAADHLIDAVEKAIYERLPMAESFEPYHGIAEREFPYYRIKVNNYIIFYVVIDSVMEVRRIFYIKRNMKKLLSEFG
jgi:plasmid stabilization system protein ParE